MRSIYVCQPLRPRLSVMKCVRFSILLISSLVLTALPSTSAAVTPGSKCSKAGVKQTHKGKVYTCIKLGKKLSWNNGVLQNKPKSVSDFKVGDIGPGGGIIFYKEPTRQSWGQYLEVAPQGWSGATSDPKSRWCDIVDRRILEGSSGVGEMNSIGNQVGDGKRNTQLMSQICASGAFVVNQYRGGGFSDWYLPSKLELNFLCRFARNQEPSFRDCGFGGNLREGFSEYYWSSSESSASSAWDQFFNIGNVNLSNKSHQGNSIRPIRAF